MAKNLSDETHENPEEQLQQPPEGYNEEQQ